MFLLKKFLPYDGHLDGQGGANKGVKVTISNPNFESARALIRDYTVVYIGEGKKETPINVLIVPSILVDAYVSALV